VESRRLRGSDPRYSGGAVRRHKPDYWLIILGSLLLAIGLIVVYSISPGLSASQGTSQNYFVTKQVVDVLLGFIAFTAAALLPVGLWRRLAKPLAIIALVGCLLVMVTPIWCRHDQQSQNNGD
jgi:cell division protein FtsW (lipid II flippase)